MSRAEDYVVDEGHYLQVHSPRRPVCGLLRWYVSIGQSMYASITAQKVFWMITGPGSFLFRSSKLKPILARQVLNKESDITGAEDVQQTAFSFYKPLEELLLNVAFCAGDNRRLFITANLSNVSTLPSIDFSCHVFSVMMVLKTSQ